MIEAMTEEELANAKEEFARDLAEIVARARRILRAWSELRRRSTPAS